MEYGNLIKPCDVGILDHRHSVLNGFNRGDIKRMKERERIRFLFFQDELTHRKNQIKNFLGGFEIDNVVIPARKTRVLYNIPVDFIRRFIESKHIQGAKSLTIKESIALEYNDCIVAVMTFSDHHRGSGGVILNRLCFEGGVKVLGGAEKMLKAYLKHNPQLGKMISWSDNRISDGNIYKKMGFSLEADMAPDYHYIKAGDCSVRYPKQSYTKTRLGIKGSSQTEWERMQELGFDRIWDCGKKRWVLESK